MPKRKARAQLPAGMVFKRVFKGKEYKMKTVKTAKGINYEVSKKLYPSPSTAAKAITQTEINGWVFWKMQ